MPQPPSHSESLKNQLARRRKEREKSARKKKTRQFCAEIRGKEAAHKKEVKRRSAPEKLAKKRKQQAEIPDIVRKAAAELLRLKEIRADMRRYREYMEPTGHLDFKFAPARHHEIIIDAVQRLKAAVDDSAAKNILLMMPPGSAKSTYVSVQFATWYFANHPDHNILACSNTTDLAENFNRRRRGVCLTKEWERLADTRLKDDARGVGHFQTEKGGSTTAAGVGSAIAGLRCQLLILDDPVQSLEQAMSVSQLDKIWNWWESDACTRLLPGGKRVVVTTRWARKDPAGRILKLVESGEEQWTIIRMPMLCDDPENDPMGRAKGEALWPEWFTDTQIAQNIRNPLRWASLYQQVPLSDSGSWVDEMHIHYVDADRIPPLDQMNIGIAGDLALEMARGDWTVFIVFGIDEARNIYILDVLRFRETPDNTVYRLFALVEQYGPSTVMMDDDNATKVFMRLLLELARAKRVSVPVDIMPIRGKNKEIRAAPMRGWFMQDRVLIKKASWNNTLYEEMHEFPDVDHDDQIDCLSLIGRKLAEMRPPRKKQETEPGTLVYHDKTGRIMLNTSLRELFREREQSLPRRNRMM